MIVFNLACTDSHRFEGWFASTDDFDRQCRGHLVTCPVCGSAEVRKELSAPRLNLSNATADGEDKPQGVAMAGPDQARLLELLRQVVASTEDVGRGFPEEARRIHYKETPARAIRGVASREEARALAEEGIEVAQLPFTPVDKTQLN